MLLFALYLEFIMLYHHVFNIAVNTINHIRVFHLHLVRDTQIFSPDFTTIDEKGKTINYDLSKIYRGYMKGNKHKK